MDLTLVRKEYSVNGIFGEIEGIGVTLEHSYDRVPKIPLGSFTCKRGTHQLEKGPPFETFEITGIPGHSGILFHAGNWNEDSTGCVLLGSARLQNMIINSAITFKKFMDLQKGVDHFILTVENS